MSSDDKVKSGQVPANPGQLPFAQIDRYRLESFLGAGAMGQVYRAVHTVTQRRSALKLLPDDLTHQPGFVARFHAEAQTLARLNHPNIVQIYTGGEADGRLFLEMELIDGGDLQKRINEYTNVTGHGLPEAEVRRILDETLAALECAHRQGVVHRDLKPANILLQKGGAVKVSDFGLAAAAGQDFQRSVVKESLSLTKVTSMETLTGSVSGSSSSFAGTILYMSPQALRGETPDPRDDLFSLGVVAYYLLAGKTPAVNYTPVSKVRPELGKEWDKFIATCLAEERTARFADAAAARAALPKVRAKFPLGWALGAAAVLALGSAAFAFWPRPAPVDAPTDPSANATVPAEKPRPTKREELQPQTIVFEPVADRPVATPPFSLLASATSGLPVSFTVLSGPATIQGTTITLTAPGSVTVRASQPGDQRYLAAASIDRTFRVLEPPPPVQKPQTLVFEPLPDRVLGDPPLELVASASSGLPVAFKLVSGPATVDGNRVTPTGVGLVTLRCEQAGDAANFPAATERSFTVKDPVPEQLVVKLKPGVEMKFLRVPAGSALLGAAPGEEGANPNETQHAFSLSEGFLLGETEVTHEQFVALTGFDPSAKRGAGVAKLPVEQVSVNALLKGNAKMPSFFERLNAALRDQGVTGWTAVLPSEDEWEYACRAGVATAFNNGNNLNGYNPRLGVTTHVVFGKSEPAPVRSLQPNAWGFYDLHGNIAELTRDGAVRGGSFRDQPKDCRSASRVLWPDAERAERTIGFRVLLKRVPAR